jgi:predicted ATP-grasp superfamily ATP-dependent carboligase
MKLMLLDGYSTRTLACVRSFGRRGIPFVVGGHTRWDMSLYSRYCRERFLYTSPYVSIPGFVADVNANAARFDADTVLPTSEAAIMACNLARDQLGVELLAPSQEEVDVLFQKRETLRLARSAGVPIPHSHTINAETASSLIDLDIRPPIVIKPNRSESIVGDRIVRGGSTVYAYSQSELIDKATTILARSPEILVQEFVNGYGVGISGVFKAGEPVTLFGHRRIRETNPLGGPSAVAVSICISDALYDATARIMRTTGYTGAAMVEYKVDRESGLTYFMEVNGRLWGSILLPIAAGLDLPYILWRVATGREVLSDGRYREGVVGRNLLGDTKHLVTVLRGRPKEWPGQFPTRWQALRDYLSLFFAESHGLIYTSDDPKPALARVLHAVLV